MSRAVAGTTAVSPTVAGTAAVSREESAGASSGLGPDTVIAGLDFGTSSVKLVIVTAAGEILARTHAAYGMHVGAAGEAEQQPEDWWHAASRALADSGIAERVDALGLTGQMQDLIPVAESGGRRRALRSALLYSDTRAMAQHERLRASIPDWERRTGNHQDASNVAAKIAWLAERDADALRHADALIFGAPGYIAWRAGGDAVCDLLTASTTGLLDLHAQGWLREAVDAAGARAAQMPRLVGTGSDAAGAGSGICGVVDPVAAAELGVRAGIPIVHAMGDAGATTDGLVGSTPGDAYLYLGTTGWLAGVTPAPSGEAAEPSPIHSLVMPGWGDRLRIGAVQSAGSTAEWALRSFLPGLDFEAADRLVVSRLDKVTVRPLCLPGIAGERTPVRDPELRGAFIGVHEATLPADLYLAVLTGVAMGLRHAADEMGIAQRRIPLVGGASASSLWRQILADVFDATIVTGDAEDPGCRSAARAAATVLGIGHSLEPLLAPGAVVAETRPSASGPALRARLDTHRRLYELLAPTFRAAAAADSALLETQ